MMRESFDQQRDIREKFDYNKNPGVCSDFFQDP